MTEQRFIDENGERVWEAKGNSFEVAAEHAAELASREEDNRVGDELIVASINVVIGPGSHISDYLVRLKKPPT